MSTAAMAIPEYNYEIFSNPIVLELVKKYSNLLVLPDDIMLIFRFFSLLLI